MRPLTSPLSPASLRKSQTSRGRSSSIAPASPLIMHFPSNRPSPSPLLISTTQPPLSQAALASPSPRLVTNMHQLSMVPSSPVGVVTTSNGVQSPALFALPASQMMPPPSSPMILPSASQSNNVPRQRSLAQLQQPIQIQSQHQLSIHQPISSASQPSPALKPRSDSMSSALTSTSDKIDLAKAITPRFGSSLGTSLPALAPVTPASLMNLGAGSGTESTPTSPKFGIHTKSKATTDSESPPLTAITSDTTITATIDSTSSQKRGTKRQANGEAVVPSGAPSTPRQLAMTPGSAAMSPMPPPNGFALISPALKPTMLNHRGSTSMLVSPRLQPQLVSPRLPGVFY
ncbi:hypothetical protein BCR41DRAFT_41577 [Lobosporangium transversale]|uniref:Uncharacterized protein n=1 Tax=Lobosporangium transversale TaxID=64571 RepID=A0A1Y2GRY4_9FUNG|nr:hypothetical protein BCR41DRAFT_41577 [Lobosporangium transversale]ORZ19233.1 hypothetical protein BCR41DRAFT_41577 [Lobosporangium transversale]|eukprot:XP_021882401.1 hypothetical protein BCR41DRAFT_41577 [Lobosporangium transversale]